MRLDLKHALLLLLAGLAFGLGSCAREEGLSNSGDIEANALGSSDVVDPLLISESTLKVPVGAVWLNTGIVLRRNQRVTIEAATPTGGAPAGSPVPDDRAPLPTYGEDGLIGRIGDSGFPFPIAGEYELQGSSLSAGEPLFVGRNIAPPQPFESDNTEAAGAATLEAAAAEYVEIDYDAEEYTLGIKVRQTDAPALLTPIDTFFAVDAGGGGLSPVFDWDEIDNASQYVVDVAAFSDFRSIEQSLPVAATSIDTGSIQINPTDPSAPVGFALPEGVWYWRVRAQINDGRLLNPSLMWTDRSVPFVFGVEGLSSLPAPSLLTPGGQVVVSEGTIIPFEVLAQPDASGLQWRYRFFSGSCGDVLDPSDSDIAVLASPWMVFQQTYRSNRIEEIEQLYGSFSSPVLDEGAWLVRIETRDGLDSTGARIGVLDYEFEAGCQ